MTKSDCDLPHCKVGVVEDVLRITAKTVHLRIIHVVFMADQFPSPWHVMVLSGVDIMNPNWQVMLRTAFW